MAQSQFRSQSSLDPFYWAPQCKFGGGWMCWKDSPSPPPAPDYKGAAEATAASQRVNQYTPYGTQTWSQGPSTQVQTGSFKGNPIYGEQPGQWSSTTTLNPTAQHALDSQMQLSA